MKKIILGAFATLMFSASAFANGTNSNATTSATSELKTLEMQRYCVIRVITTHADGTKSTQTYAYPVDSNPDSTAVANAQCQAIRAAHIAALD